MSDPSKVVCRHFGIGIPYGRYFDGFRSEQTEYDWGAHSKEGWKGISDFDIDAHRTIRGATDFHHHQPRNICFISRLGHSPPALFLLRLEV